MDMESTCTKTGNTVCGRSTQKRHHPHSNRTAGGGPGRDTGFGISRSMGRCTDRVHQCGAVLRQGKHRRCCDGRQETVLRGASGIIPGARGAGPVHIAPDSQCGVWQAQPRGPPWSDRVECPVWFNKQPYQGRDDVHRVSKTRQRRAGIRSGWNS